MNKFAFMHETIAEPNIDRIEPCMIAKAAQCHFLGNLAHRCKAIRFALTHVPLGKCPFAVRVHDHREVRDAANALEN